MRLTRRDGIFDDAAQQREQGILAFLAFEAQLTFHQRIAKHSVAGRHRSFKDIQPSRVLSIQCSREALIQNWHA